VRHHQGVEVAPRQRNVQLQGGAEVSLQAAQKRSVCPQKNGLEARFR
jgi:hypothetical protein